MALNREGAAPRINADENIRVASSIRNCHSGNAATVRDILNYHIPKYARVLCLRVLDMRQLSRSLFVLFSHLLNQHCPQFVYQEEDDGEGINNGTV